MKYSVIVLACVLAIAAAQFNNGQYVPENQKQNYFNRYNQYNNRYNQYNPFNRYQQYQNNPYKPFGSTTVRPFFFSSTPSTVLPSRATFAPFKPFASVSTVAPSTASPAPEEPAASAAPAPSAAPVPSAAPAPLKPVITVLSAAPAVAVPVSKYYSDAASAGILSYENEVNPDGSFKYAFQTSNGIAAQEEGAPRSFYAGENAVAPVVAQGSFAWISPEGQDVSITYVADENGYQPSGAAIPQAPEIPALIARALEYIARTVPASAVPAK